MAVAATMVRMKIAIIRNSMTGGRAGLIGSAAVLGVILAGGTIFLAFQSADLLAAAYAVWMLGWILGPAFAGGGDETLRPEYFSLIGLKQTRLALGLLMSAFVGVAPLVSLLALTGLAVFGVRQSPGATLVAVPAMLLQLTLFVLMSRVAVALLGLALRSRVGAIGAGVLNGLILAMLGQGWVFGVAFGRQGELPPTVATVVRYLPSGWGLLAVESSPWMLVAMALAIGLLLAAWAALLTLRAGSVKASARGRRPMRATTAQGAVVAKELRTWSRDLVRTHQLTFALAYGIFFAGAPLVLGWYGMLPWAAPIFVVMAAAMTANLYGGDGTALWLLIMASATDVRGRQRAWLQAVAPIAIVLAVAFTAVNGGPWPVILAVLPAVLGGAAGLVPLVAVYALVPGTDPHKRAGNPLKSSEDDGGMTGLAYLMLFLALLTGVPAGIVAVVYGWPGVAVGVLTGALCFWGFGLLAERRISAAGPELLEMMRTGRRPESSWSFTIDDMPQAKRTLVWTCMGLGAIPLVPQGVVAAVFVANGQVRHSWFLATYMPPGLQFPVAMGMILLGIGMYATGIVTYKRHITRR
ncbi:hypothetical protein ACIBG8_50685 [Nonomuraea sp. NPDC050556]|uniref:hypothetical protein n=1 Tax=Nonomuraea sp. NPDC050556 TaxID=3364369 RepID=UPI0037AAB7C1